MDADLSSTVGLRSRGLVDSANALAQLVVASGLALTAIALLIFVRRLAGALERPAPPAALIGLAIMVAALGYLMRRYAKAAIFADSTAAASQALVAWMPSVCLLLLTFGLSWPLDRILDWLVWGPLWIADVVWRTKFLATMPKDERQLGEVSGAAFERRAALEPDDDQDKPPDADECLVMQRIVRMRDSQGRESLRGSLRAEFAPGQRSAQVYVGFCPPFEGAPTIEVEQSGGPPARIAVGQALSHGARIDVRLAGDAAEASQVAIELFGASVEPRCTSTSAAV